MERKFSKKKHCANMLLILKQWCLQGLYMVSRGSWSNSMEKNWNRFVAMTNWLFSTTDLVIHWLQNFHMIDLTFFFSLLWIVFLNIPEYKNFILYFLASQHYKAQHKILSRLSINIESEWIIMLKIANPCGKCQKLNSWVSDVGALWCLFFPPQGNKDYTSYKKKKL